MSENSNDTETEYSSVEDTLSMHITVSNETTLVFEISNLINVESIILHQRKDRNQFKF